MDVEKYNKDIED